MLGSYASTWTFENADEGLPGAAPGATLTLNLTGVVTIHGDYDLDGQLDAGDIDSMFAAIGGDDLWYDLDGDEEVDADDAGVLIHAVFGTEYGDASLDGEVNGSDYTIWADHYEASGGWGEGDFTGNGFVDGADYTLWADNYLNGCPKLPVPEPLTLALLGAAGPALMGRRRK